MTVMRDSKEIEIKSSLIEFPTTFDINDFYKSNDWKLDLGFPTIDRLIGGLRPGKVSVIPEGTILGGVWETWIAINIILKRGCPTLFYTPSNRTSLAESIAFELSKLNSDIEIDNTAAVKHVRYLAVKKLLNKVPLEENYHPLTLEGLEAWIHETSSRGIFGKWLPKLLIIRDIEDLEVNYAHSNDHYRPRREEKCLIALSSLKKLAELYEIHILISKKPLPVSEEELHKAVDFLLEFEETAVNVPGRSRFPDLVDDEFRNVGILKNAGGKTGDFPICFIYDKHGLREGFSEWAEETFGSKLGIVLDFLGLNKLRTMVCD